MKPGPRWMGAALLALLLQGTALAQTPGRNESGGPSWMERWFGMPGMMLGAAPGYGPYGNYGPGAMMGRCGMGAMMGMMGMGGMMGWGGHGGPYDLLDLSEAQRGKINQIQDEVRRKHWELMGKMLDEQARLRDLYGADKRDPGAIGQQSMKLAELRRQLIEGAVDAQNRIEALLSKEQRERLRRYGACRFGGDD